MKTAIQRAWVAGLVLTCAFGRLAAPAGAADDAPDKPQISDYKIQPLDTIYVDVFGETNLCRECKVQASGEISYPLLGNVSVAGETAVEAQKRLKDRLGADFLVNPQVTVTVKTYRVRTVTVMGEVNKPLTYIIPEEQRWSIAEAIGQAGGFTKLAKRSKIEFTRNGVTKTYNFEKLLKDLNDPGKTIWVESGDLINVPQTTF